ncbi:hypothetical protein Cpap_1452 [Ruminiclostridium papyrosolvens DSM 2782]|uniref:Uncharacterized protein n=1 Tax=Ruminiclostridium papyrosolvens DSM 2782 TaxID=588581 RepID=F1TE94_9FIRM|nr:hypothetical protein [Ruminiclostridium papyrosolvens]EGD47060.1 hypothetical protein Cpap_1452 [Ruminiclostridium papyrosolvens DSM 2782]WES36001.1 hypothetical protein P0092_08585 [Ruminiclostridium papyrosolvens DSM 2782]WES36099.1 hypothetical protein P0092_09085 [Ruminiclostridium papyrosolvens DSM 2782]
MENFSILNTCILSIPQFFLCFMFSLVVIGKGSEVPFKCDSNKFIISLLKILFLASIVSFIGSFIGTFIPSMNIVSIAYMVVYCIILKYFYNTTWMESLLGVAAFSILIISFESLYVPYCIRYFYNGSEANLLNSPALKIFLCFIPERIVQIIAIISFWNFSSVIQKLKQYQIGLKGFIFIVFTLFFIELNLTKIVIAYFPVFSLDTKILLGLCCACSGLLNFVILYHYIKVITKVSKYHIERSVENGQH